MDFLLKIWQQFWLRHQQFQLNLFSNIMKLNIGLLALVVFVSYFTCKNLKKSTISTAPPAETVKDYSNAGYNWNASHVIEGSNPDSAFTYQIKQAPARVNVPWDKISPPSTSRRSFLATNWWNIRMAYQPSDTTAHVNYMGKSLKFREDQTFDIIQNAKVQETGHWGFDDEKKIIYISCNNTYFNNSWKVQENGFRMVWLGNTDLNVTGIQMRMDGSNKDPMGQ